jgi:hypothetical protein
MKSLFKEKQLLYFGLEDGPKPSSVENKDPAAEQVSQNQDELTSANEVAEADLYTALDNLATVHDLSMEIKDHPDGERTIVFATTGDFRDDLFYINIPTNGLYELHYNDPDKGFTNLGAGHNLTTLISDNADTLFGE